MLRYFVGILIFLSLLFTVYATEVTLISPYVCGLANNLTCIAKDFTIISSTNTVSTWKGVFSQYANDSSNRSEIYYVTSSGISSRVKIASDFLTGCSGAVNRTYNDEIKLIDAFLDASENKVYFAYTTNHPSCNGGSSFLKSYDLGSNTVSTIATTVAGPFGAPPHYKVGGIAVRPFNSTWIMVASGHSDCNISLTDCGFAYPHIRLVFIDRNTGGFVADQKITVGPNSNFGDGRGRRVVSMANNGTHILVFYEDNGEPSSSAGPSNYVAFGLPGIAPSITTEYQVFDGAGNDWATFAFDKRQGMANLDKDGNTEIYHINISSGAFIRKTTSSRDEWLTSELNLSDGTVVLTYFVPNDNTTYANTVCTSFGNISLGQNCEGFIGGGNLCTTCFAWNGSACVGIPGCLNQFPTVQLIVYDRACKGSLRPDVGGVFEECLTGGSFAVQDWVYIQYLINGKFVLPNGYNESQFENSVQQSASCTACDLTDSNCVGLTGFTHFARSDGVERNKPYWSFDARAEPSTPFVDSNGMGQLINVRCVSNVSDTSVSNQFYVANTFRNIVADSFKGGFAGRYIDSVNQNESPISFQRIIEVKPHLKPDNAPIESLNPYGLLSNTQCFFKMSPLATGDLNTLMDFGENAILGDRYQTRLILSIFNPSLSPRNYKVTSACSVKKGNDDASQRSMASLIQKNFNITDRCTTQGFANSSLRLIVVNKNGTVTTNFKSHENVYVNAFYSVPTLAGPVAWDTGQCSLILINETSGQTIDTSSVMRHLSGGFYQDYVQSDRFIDDLEWGQGINFAEFDLVDGTYRVNVSCRNTDISKCVLPQATTKVFTFNTSDGCVGTNDACTLVSCSACGNQVITCENNRQFTVSSQCVSRTCASSDNLNTPQCQNEILWSIQTDPVPSEVPCGDDDLVIRLKLFKGRNQVPPYSELSDLACTSEIAPIFGQTPLADPVVLEFPRSTGSLLELKLKSQLNRFKFDYCGNQFQVKTQCISKNFSNIKESIVRFSMGEQGADCRSGDVIVRDAECLYKVTGNEADKPKICNAGQFIDNSRVCGCSPGTQTNTTTNSCDGPKIIGSFFDLFNFKWLSLSVLLAIIILGPIALDVVRTIRGGKNITIIPPNGNQRK